jgi:hypothetical protein
MRARVTRSVDRNTLALRRMLQDNGLWLVTVHNGQITKFVHIPKEQPIEKLIEEHPITHTPAGRTQP